MTRHLATVRRGTTLSDLLYELLAHHASQRELADKLELAPATVGRLLHGESVPQEGTLEKIADYAELPLPEVRRIAGRGVGLPEPFVLPMEANQLNARERAVICELVRVLLEPHGPRVTRGRAQP